MIQVFGYREGGLNLGVQPYQSIPVYAGMGPTFTGFAKNETEELILAVAGVALSWQGVGEAWAFVTPEAKNHGLFLTREVRKKLLEIATYYELHRVHTAAQKQFKEACKWCESLGFKREGLMRQFGPNKEDYYRYALFF